MSGCREKGLRGLVSTLQLLRKQRRSNVHEQLKRITSILPRAREKQRRESVLLRKYDSKQAKTYKPRASKVQTKTMFVRKSNQLEEEE